MFVRSSYFPFFARLIFPRGYFRITVYKIVKKIHSRVRESDYFETEPDSTNPSIHWQAQEPMTNRIGFWACSSFALLTQRVIMQFRNKIFDSLHCTLRDLVKFRIKSNEICVTFLFHTYKLS